MIALLVVAGAVGFTAIVLTGWTWWLGKIEQREQAQMDRDMGRRRGAPVLGEPPPSAARHLRPPPYL